MGWYRLPKPGEKDQRTGEELGPCIDENCGHRDCACTRERAERICLVCGEPIGYDRPFYFEEDGALTHFACYHQKGGKRGKGQEQDAKAGG